MRSVKDIAQFSVHAINDLLAKAIDYSQQHSTQTNDKVAQIVSLFFENSTRTSLSFHLAAKRLGHQFIELNLARSSNSKGESFIDLIQTVAAMNIDCVVLRHRDDKAINLAMDVAPNTSFINAGSGMRSHPSQVLGDYALLQQSLGRLSGKHLVVVGDIKHSRVARSLVTLINKLGECRITLCAPDFFLVDEPCFDGCHYSDDLLQCLHDADAVYALRVQKERIVSLSDRELNTYVQHFQVSVGALEQAKPYVLHPGPVNRGVEIAEEVMDTYQNKLILQQVTYGVYARMALYDYVIQ